MGETVRVPKPVKERIEQEAEAGDISQGTVVREWMQKADELEMLDSGEYKIEKWR